MRAINHYIIAKNIKTEPKKVAGLIMTDETDQDNRYIKAEIISIGNLVEGIKEKILYIMTNTLDIVYNIKTYYIKLSVRVTWF